MSSETLPNRNKADQIHRTKQLDPKTVASFSRHLSPLDHVVSRPWRIGFTVIEYGVELIFDLTTEILIGRSHPDPEFFDGIDLAPYNAYEKGMSRRHARLLLEGETIIMVDNQSANGTFINDQRLEPYHQYVLRNGDHVKFGALEIKVKMLINPFEQV